MCYYVIDCTSKFAYFRKQDELVVIWNRIWLNIKYNLIAFQWQGSKQVTIEEEKQNQRREDRTWRNTDRKV